jgi:hypothetical protein
VSWYHLFRSFNANPANDTQYSIRIAYRTLSKAGFIVIVIVLISLGLSDCAEQSTPYRPPTFAVHATPLVVASVTPTPTSQPIETPLPIATLACTNNLTFLEDLSLSDGTVVHPGDNLDKRWLVQNSGSCNWDERYQFKFVSGSDLNASIEQALYPARSGAKATIRIIFTAPSEPGTYQSAWQAYDPLGQPFGDPVYIQIIVSSGTP